ncbi:cobalamin B12-binding domain-containing protein [Desulfotomaculum copahuensis]|uniref:Methylmalonyl-CoA mutase n=1 Tax=Desulfotomaculum copahuensis TaxID=1838280 RepID=A0A1B7LAH7_9FIRM|nr:cobalamin B12-binding domain-containing protein [Desulfotomaculum copahuensis]OAT79325.1 methylmalonyl-CoA mutase [Desulfotomaculum copahuensis]
MKSKTIRILLAKPGLDGHDRGAKVIARALQDAGFEVVYTGLRNTPEQIVSTAVQEDVDVIGLSVLSGAHIGLCRRVLELLKDNQMMQVPVIVGGIIPDDNVPVLKDMGVLEVFGPGSDTHRVMDIIKQQVISVSHGEHDGNLQ